jgi:hypothetical protein
MDNWRSPRTKPRRTLSDPCRTFVLLVVAPFAFRELCRLSGLTRSSGRQEKRISPRRRSKEAPYATLACGTRAFVFLVAQTQSSHPQAASTLDDHAEFRNLADLLHQSWGMDLAPGQAQFFAGPFHPFCDATSSRRRGSSCVKCSFITNANAPLS